ncbi:hypothetical protein MTO96_013425 [Rhipicephalus appendiculatus]
MAILSRLPKLVREAPSYCKQLVELSLVGVTNEDDRSLVQGLGQLPHLRLVTQCPRSVTDHAQVPVAENCKELCKPTFPIQRVTDGRLYLVARQQLLESEMCFDQCLIVWSSFDLLDGLPCEETVKIPFLTKALLPFPEGYNMNFVDYIARSLGRMLLSTTALPHRASNCTLLNRVSLFLTGQENFLPLDLPRVSNDRTLGVSSAALKIFFLEQAELGLELVVTGLKTLTLCMFHLCAATVSEQCPFLRNLKLEDLQTLSCQMNYRFCKTPTSSGFYDSSYSLTERT